MNATYLHNQISVGVGVALTAVANGEDVVGAVIDMQGAAGLEYVLQVGAYTDGDVTPLVEDSDNGTDFTAVADTFLLGNAADLSDGVVATDLQGGVVATDLQGGVVATNLQGGVVATNLQGGVALTAAGVSKIGYIGSKRYVRLTAVTAAGSTLSVGASAIKFGLRIRGETAPDIIVA